MKQKDFGIQFSTMLIVLIGVMHIFLPTMGYDQAVVQSMNEEVAVHFYYLGTYAICSFLLGFGFLSFLIIRIDNSNMALFSLRRSFSTISIIIWGLRLIMEFIYPVTLSIFNVRKPHLFLAFAIFLILVGYIYDLIFNRKKVGAI